MTLSSSIEQRLSRRPPSTAPARAAARVLGIEKFSSDAAHRRFGTLTHWGYGVGWGVPRAVLRALGLHPALATAVHGAALWTSEQVMLPALDVAPPFVFWSRKEIAIDAWHHLVYTVATALAYEVLDASQAERTSGRVGSKSSLVRRKRSCRSSQSW
jgi:hypothetical protein